MDAHSVIKKLQETQGFAVARSISTWAAGARVAPGAGVVGVRRNARGAVPEFWRGICQHLIEHYWTGMSEEQIGDMINMMPEEMV